MAKQILIDSSFGMVRTAISEKMALWLSQSGIEGRLETMQLSPATTGIFATTDVLGGRTQLRCFQTWTNPGTHDIIRANLDRAPMYNGSIEGTGPRYCPSIEDKIGRFADKDSHPLYLEPEGWRSHEIYVQGLSTSLPPDVQEELLRTIPGLENARITRFGYAVEYDALDPTELNSTMQSRRLPGLFMAGQINGTSGYEEAAGQGVVAGANAAAFAQGNTLRTLQRSDAYIGVMIDDLVSKPFTEPYRMLTSRAEYRLVLRSDTAAPRLADHGRGWKLIDDETVQKIRADEAAIAEIVTRLETTWLGDNPRHAAALAQHGIEPVTRSTTALELVRRPGMNLHQVMASLAALDRWEAIDVAPWLIDRAEVAAKYSSFIEKELKEADRQRQHYSQEIPSETDFSRVIGLRVEAMHALERSRPSSIGQAVRTAGVTPSDIGALLVHLKRDSSVKYGAHDSTKEYNGAR